MAVVQGEARRASRALSEAPGEPLPRSASRQVDFDLLVAFGQYGAADVGLFGFKRIPE